MSVVNKILAGNLSCVNARKGKEIVSVVGKEPKRGNGRFRRRIVVLEDDYWGQGSRMALSKRQYRLVPEIGSDVADVITKTVVLFDNSVNAATSENTIHLSTPVVSKRIIVLGKNVI